MDNDIEGSVPINISLFNDWPLERKLLALLLHTYKSVSGELVDQSERSVVEATITKFGNAVHMALAAFQAAESDGEHMIDL